MKKERVVELISDRLREESVEADRAAREAREMVTNRETAGGAPHDTLSMEASFLAEAQAKRASAAEAALVAYQSLSLEHFDANTPILLTALVTLETQGKRERKVLFFGPEAGGLRIDADGKEITVVTPASPLGRELLTKIKGDVIHLTLEGKPQNFKVVDVV